MSFHSLLYTDCRPGEGLRGGSGFQFQAVSPGTSDAIMTAVQRSALYDPPVAWMREKRPAASYPPSLTHFWDGAYITARGCYLGTEVDGSREGNQFTHAIATSDRRHYDVVRPAQLWEAPWWRDEPSSTTECPPVPPEPVPGPCGVESVQRWLRKRSAAEEWLTCLLSAVEECGEAGGRRILFVGRCPEEILTWVAAATLLLPQERALGVGFRVYTTNPHYCRQEIVAVHPDWSEQFAGSGEFAVFDLAGGKRPDVVACESAAYWVPRFLRADPYDVVDAVELAHRLAREGGRERPSWADMAASSVLLLEESELERPGEVAHWLASTSGATASEAAVPVLEAVLSSRPSADDLRRLAALEVPVEIAERTHLARLLAEIEDCVSGRGELTGSVPVVPEWTAEGREQAVRSVESAAEQVPPQRMDVLLRVATSFGLAPRPRRFHASARRFVRWWVDRPAADVDLSLWSCGAEMVAHLREELADRLRADGEGRVAQDVRRFWWELLVPTVGDPAAPLEALVIAAASEAGERSRREVFTTVLRQLDEGDRQEELWNAAFRFAEPSPADVVAFFSELHRVATPLAERGLEVLEDATVSADLLDALPHLSEHMQSPRHAALLELVHHDEALQAWLQKFRRDPGAKAGRAFPALPREVLRSRRCALVDALFDASPALVGKAVLAGGEQLQAEATRALPDIWSAVDERAHRRDRAVVLAVLISSRAGLTARTSRNLNARIDQWVHDSDRRDHRRISRLLRAASPDAAGHLHERIGAAGRGKTPSKTVRRWLFGSREERG